MSNRSERKIHATLPLFDTLPHSESHVDVSSKSLFSVAIRKYVGFAGNIPSYRCFHVPILAYDAEQAIELAALRHHCEVISVKEES